MTFVDGYLAAVPAANKDAYLETARTAADLFLKHGALSVRECWGEDVPDGDVTSFPKAVHLEEGEVVVFSWVEWPSREARDAAMPALHADMEANMGMEAMPFDGQRLMFGGFQTILFQSN